ncbi:hypothetical protein E7Z59_14415 [Robertkochia marina]|uniref:DUF4179 domain-containing protein n=1 Tax=Robertkochia marina TaxID=1227945 RepID=A0A4S3LYB6_9FLAO|nr:hypothetical protein [Robertkochia marina]THD65777.1 hypothetical protein E7Z59_14415 [Robertkochia marina]TRZ46539.1 hypothetical protein D3A96_02935 [Robertkochia marina]
MAQDIRELLKNDSGKQRESMPAGHREDFKNLLDQEMPQTGNNISMFWLRIAAGFFFLLAVGTFVFYQQGGSGPEVNDGFVSTPTQQEESVKEITLGDLSPDLSKIEQYYTANINMELASLEMNDETSQLVDGYMNRLSELNDEYKRLTDELNEIGPNQQTVDALIDNLQLRLDLLYRLKDQLKELKENKNENFELQTV